jgi:hypothetical protein
MLNPHSKTGQTLNDVFKVVTRENVLLLKNTQTRTLYANKPSCVHVTVLISVCFSFLLLTYNCTYMYCKFGLFTFLFLFLHFQQYAVSCNIIPITLVPFLVLAVWQPTLNHFGGFAALRWDLFIYISHAYSINRVPVVASVLYLFIYVNSVSHFSHLPLRIPYTLSSC